MKTTSFLLLFSFLFLMMFGLFKLFGKNFRSDYHLIFPATASAFALSIAIALLFWMFNQVFNRLEAHSEKAHVLIEAYKNELLPECQWETSQKVFGVIRLKGQVRGRKIQLDFSTRHLSGRQLSPPFALFLASLHIEKKPGEKPDLSPLKEEGQSLLNTPLLKVKLSKNYLYCIPYLKIAKDDAKIFIKPEDLNQWLRKCLEVLE